MKRILTSLALSGMVATGLVAVSSAPAQADDRICRGTIGKRVVDGNVIVPRGAVCTLNGTTVKGDVEVKRNATVRVKGAYVDGNIQGENHKWVAVRPLNGKRTVVDGNIQLKQGGGGNILNNRVDGDIQLFSNRGKFTVRNNTVDGNLQCKSNKPKPVGSKNRVKGNKEGQCRGM